MVKTILLTTKLVMVGVSRTGVEALVVMMVPTPSPLSGKLVVTAVMVRLTLGTTTTLLLADVCILLLLMTEAVVWCGRGDDVRDLTALLLLVVLLLLLTVVAWVRVNMVGRGCFFASRSENFLLVTWAESLTNMGRWWRHFSNVRLNSSPGCYESYTAWIWPSDSFLYADVSPVHVSSFAHSTSLRSYRFLKSFIAEYIYKYNSY